MQNRLLPLSYSYTVWKFQSWLFWHIIHVTIFICSEVMTHNMIICRSYGGHLGFMQMRPLSLLYRPTWLYIILYCIYFFIFICSKIMRHDLIIGKSCGGHLVFMKIMPHMKEVFYAPQTKSFISPCATFLGFIPIFTPWWKSPWTKNEDFNWQRFCI